MSLHYEWALSLWLKPDLPHQFESELLWQLGMTEERPKVMTLPDWGAQVLGASDGECRMPGGPVAILQPAEDPSSARGLFVRTFIKDDGMYAVMQHIPSWLAPWSATQGWIRFAREESDLHIWLNFYVQGDHAYVGRPGEEPKGMPDGAPPFSLRHTLS